MKTYKEKAKELVDKLHDEIDWNTRAMPKIKRLVAKKCALICVDKRLELLNDLDDYFHEAGHDRTTLEKAVELEKKVKQEILKL